MGKGSIARCFFAGHEKQYWFASKQILGSGLAICFYPVKCIQDRISNRAECERIIKDSNINLRGWDYLYFPIHQGEDSKIYFGSDYVEAFIDWWEHREAWRYYQSAQFIHYVGIHEDWFAENEWADKYLKKIKPGTVLSVINTIYTVSEIFEFTRRLAKQGLYDDGININITLYSIKDRKLVMFDPGRVPLSDDYVAY